MTQMGFSLTKGAKTLSSSIGNPSTVNICMRMRKDSISERVPTLEGLGPWGKGQPLCKPVPALAGGRGLGRLGPPQRGPPPGSDAGGDVEKRQRLPAGMGRGRGRRGVGGGVFGSGLLQSSVGGGVPSKAIGLRQGGGASLD